MPFQPDGHQNKANIGEQEQTWMQGYLGAEGILRQGFGNLKQQEGNVSPGLREKSIERGS